MSGPLATVGDNELAFFFQTNEPIPARPLLNFIYEVERITLTRRFFGPSGLVEVTEVRTGTKLVRLTFNQKVAAASLTVAAVGVAATVGQLGLNIADRIKQPAGRLAETVAEMCLDNGVAECVITTPEMQIKVGRDELPAIETVLQKRAGIAGPKRLMPSSESRQGEKAVGSANIQELHALPDEQLMVQDELRAELVRRRDGRVYTVVGYLRPPSADGNTVPNLDWEFRTESGKTYIARGIDPGRVGRAAQGLMVIRAEIIGRDEGFTVLSVKDVFEPEEP